MDDIRDLLADEAIHAARELRQHDRQLFQRAVLEIDRLRLLADRNLKYGKGYEIGEGERIALAHENDRLRYENRILIREANEKSEASKQEDEDPSLHAKIDRLSIIVEHIHKLLGDERVRNASY